MKRGREIKERNERAKNLWESEIEERGTEKRNWREQEVREKD